MISSNRDSYDDYYVNMISEGDDSPKNFVDEKDDPKYLFVKFGNSEFNIVVDTGSVGSLTNKRIAQEIELHHSSAWWSLQLNSMKLKSFNNSPIKNLGTLSCDVQSNSWNGDRVDLIAVSNSNR